MRGEKYRRRDILELGKMEHERAPIISPTRQEKRGSKSVNRFGHR